MQFMAKTTKSVGVTDRRGKCKHSEGKYRLKGSTTNRRNRGIWESKQTLRDSLPAGKSPNKGPRCQRCQRRHRLAYVEWKGYTHTARHSTGKQMLRRETRATGRGGEVTHAEQRWVLASEVARSPPPGQEGKKDLQGTSLGIPGASEKGEQCRRKKKPTPVPAIGAKPRSARRITARRDVQRLLSSGNRPAVENGEGRAHWGILDGQGKVRKANPASNPKKRPANDGGTGKRLFKNGAKGWREGGGGKRKGGEPLNRAPSLNRVSSEAAEMRSYIKHNHSNKISPGT